MDGGSTSATEGLSVDNASTNVQCVLNVLTSKARNKENFMGKFNNSLSLFLGANKLNGYSKNNVFNRC